MIRALLLFAVIGPVAAAAGPDALDNANIIFLGEQHDNPAHHQRQAELVAELSPSALVFEMLTPDQAAAATADVRGDEDALEAALGWADSGWPDFSLYWPIFAASSEAEIYGAAVPRNAARSAMDGPIADSFGADAAEWGLTDALPDDQQVSRQALQAEAHCNALPEEMLPVMVEIQRLRDAVIARTALEAFRETGGPVAVITGNGHARRDWGAPAYLARVAPDVTVAALGQGEQSHGQPEGEFDLTEIGPDVDRGDPCAEFREG